MHAFDAGLKVCRYLFRRCDNEPAPWSGELAGDGPWAEAGLPDEATAELEHSSEAVTHAGGAPCWDHSADAGKWVWVRDPPVAAAASARTGASTLERQVKTVRLHSLHVLHAMLCNLGASCRNGYMLEV